MSWLPYVVLIFIGTFKDLHDLNFSTSILPSIFVDLPSIWSPLLEILFNSNIRNNLLFIKNTKSEKIQLLSSYSFNNKKLKLDSNIIQTCDMDLLNNIN
jgi:hypothetical protein